MSELQRKVVDEIPHEWEKIATLLEFAQNKIDSIKVEPKNRDNASCCFSMLSEWLKEAKGTGKKLKTRTTLRDVLIECNHKDIAETLLQ